MPNRGAAVFIDGAVDAVGALKHDEAAGHRVFLERGIRYCWLPHNKGAHWKKDPAEGSRRALPPSRPPPKTSRQHMLSRWFTSIKSLLVTPDDARRYDNARSGERELLEAASLKPVWMGSQRGMSPPGGGRWSKSPFAGQRNQGSGEREGAPAVWVPKNVGASRSGAKQPSAVALPKPPPLAPLASVTMARTILW